MANPSYPGRYCIGNFATVNKKNIQQAATQVGLDLVLDDSPFDTDDLLKGSAWVLEDASARTIDQFWSAYFILAG